MADRGNIGSNASFLSLLPTLPTDFWVGCGARPSDLYAIATLPSGYWQGVVVIGGELRDTLRYNGAGKIIAGIVTLDGSTVGRRVRIHHRATGLPCVTLTSDGDGRYQADGFSGLEEYYVVALPSLADGTNAVIADRIRGA